MLINHGNVLSVAQAAEDFLRVTRMVEEDGLAVITQNDVPRYVVTVYDDERNNTQTADDGKTMRTALRLIDKHRLAFEKL